MFLEFSKELKSPLSIFYTEQTLKKISWFLLQKYTDVENDNKFFSRNQDLSPFQNIYV